MNKIFAAIIIFVTFFSPEIGIIGLSAVILTNLLAYAGGLNRDEIRKGIYGFNAVFLGLALGYELEFTGIFIVLFITAILMLLLITSWLNGFFAKQHLPFLSFPFLITYWIIILASSTLTNLHINSNQINTLNEFVQQKSSLFYQFSHFADTLKIHPLFLIYFKTLSGTFFSESIMGGILIAIGLLYFSRIAFTLSIIGFASAYYFYILFGADVNDLNYHLLGSNFIFMSIAIGCFYLIPNSYSYLAVLLLTPVLMLILIFLSKILAIFQLKAYTLSFSVLTTAFLFSLHQRWLHRFFHIVSIQYFSAEKTIYKYLSSVKRFKNEHHIKIALPFWGEWMVSQGYEGKITHLGEWSKALDFVILDSQLKTYREPGIVKEDFYSYNKPVIAPYDGYVYNIINTVEDNDITDINTNENWGNTIVINHLHGIFSQISHLKKDSFKISIGEFVTKGTVVAACGNSGRSPEPHIHFQLQNSPVIGAPTMAYPISYFIEQKNNKQDLKISEIPKEGTFISNIQLTKLLTEIFSLPPGKKINIQSMSGNSHLNWEVYTDAYNHKYIYCHQSKSYAYFVNDGTMFYFTDFEGNRDALLFEFYLAAYRILLGYYKEILISDNVPLIHFNYIILQWFQDIIAPFYLFTKANYTSQFTFIDEIHSPSKIIITSKVEVAVMNKRFRETNFELEFHHNKNLYFTVNRKGKTENYLCTGF